VAPRFSILRDPGKYPFPSIGAPGIMSTPV